MSITANDEHDEPEEKKKPAAKKAPKRPQDGLHVALRPIRYGNPDHPMYRSLVGPESEPLPYPHLSNGEYNTALRIGAIAPVKE